MGSFIKNNDLKSKDIYIEKFDKTNIEKCRNCIGKFTCTKCIARLSIQKNEISNFECIEHRRKTLSAIGFLAELIKQGKYDNFVNQYKAFRVGMK